MDEQSRSSIAKQRDNNARPSICYTDNTYTSREQREGGHTQARFASDRDSCLTPNHSLCYRVSPHRFPTVGLAIERGLSFEVCYTAALGDARARRQLVSNVLALIRVTKGKNIIFSSAAVDAISLRGPYDVSNLYAFLSACEWLDF